MNASSCMCVCCGFCFCECDFNYIVFECLYVLILSSIVEDRDSIVTKENTRCEHFSRNNDDNAFILL